MDGTNDVPMEAARIRDQATLDLLARWDDEDQPDDPEEIRRRQAEREEFRRLMNEDSLPGRPIYR